MGVPVTPSSSAIRKPENAGQLTINPHYTQNPSSALGKVNE
jgi:hypothetical protein